MHTNFQVLMLMICHFYEITYKMTVVLSYLYFKFECINWLNLQKMYIFLPQSL